MPPTGRRTPLTALLVLAALVLTLAATLGPPGYAGLHAVPQER